MEKEGIMEAPKTENAPAMNLPRFLLALLIKPRAAFAQLDRIGKPHFLWAAAAMLVVIWLGAVVTLPVTQREAAKGYEAVMEQTSGSFTEEQRTIMEQQREFTTSPVFLVASQGITETIGYPILWLSAAGVLYLLSLAFGGQARFGSILSMTVWVSAVEILGKVALVAGTLLRGQTPSPGLSYLVSAENISEVTPVMAGLAQILAKVTLFEIWYLVLIGIGIVACAKVTRMKGAVITILYWLASLLPPVAMAVLGAAVSSSFLG
jgi:hypothetical protein